MQYSVTSQQLITVCGLQLGDAEIILDSKTTKPHVLEVLQADPRVTVTPFLAKPQHVKSSPTKTTKDVNDADS